jgi:hypothetical protein
VFSVRSALRNSRTVLSALSLLRLYNTSPLAAKKSPREFLFEFRGSMVIKQEMARSEVQVSVLRSVARSQLVETENPSACATVNRKLCKLATALYLL